MKSILQGFFIIFLTSISSLVSAQNQYSPFGGSIFIGSGISSVIDFNIESEGYKIPFQVGVKSYKYINHNSFIEVGINISSRGTSFTEVFTYRPGGTFIYGSRIDIFSIDIPITLFTRFGSFDKRRAYYFFGIRNSIIPVVPKILDYDHTVVIEDYVFRKYNIASNVGVGIEVVKNFRIDLSVNLFMRSLVKNKHKTYFGEQVDYYNNRLFPVESILAVNYMFK